MVVIHCSATPNGRSHEVNEIRRWHMFERGWSDIGYHFVITVDGRIQAGRPMERPGAHARGCNQHSIGVCMVGEDAFSKAQERALSQLLSDLEAQLPDEFAVVGHRQLNPHKSCPGFDVARWRVGEAPFPLMAGAHIAQQEPSNGA
ncbi:putative N-acetylmuramoyl-L-alanine amidase [Magnetofaba australis IT-1]|uniref:Putative N-acetylmuramoyl-L-alanine amidase n=2 Tax=Magnetofaba TaxID=1472292 RepID=A0A1Y2K068_9PROT|nr:putative N-acetylmuramoyl-L-alanine amidase [Magnetofaba australis IT-1]